MIDTELVARLIEAQFPGWAGLPIKPIVPGGWDNVSFRLGDEMTVRLPRMERYAPQAQKEHVWLPRLAPALPVPIPQPLALGEPGEGFPWPWSVRDWIKGETASAVRIAAPAQFATDLAAFLAALHRIDPAGGPPPGQHNFCRGGPVSTYDAETRRAIDALGERIDARAAGAIWDAALQSKWEGPPVWVHGDVSADNLLVDDGALCGVIDFGCCAVGDPACDLVIVWTLLEGESREIFRNALALDQGAWTRARGWALWKALITLAGVGKSQRELAVSTRVVKALIAEHASLGASCA
jgi:aminoglycoside phosphotransferase (APT) family kinase protein